MLNSGLIWHGPKTPRCWGKKMVNSAKTSWAYSRLSVRHRKRVTMPPKRFSTQTTQSHRWPQWCVPALQDCLVILIFFPLWGLHVTQFFTNTNYKHIIFRAYMCVHWFLGQIMRKTSLDYDLCMMCLLQKYLNNCFLWSAAPLLHTFHVNPCPRLCMYIVHCVHLSHPISN